MQPLAGLLAGDAQHQVAQRQDQPGFLGNGNELHRWQHAPGRVLPAHQRLDTGDQVAGQMQLGLVVHQQLLLGNRLAQLVLQMQTVNLGAGQVGGVELVAIAAAPFGVLHRLIGAVDQLQAVARIVREPADADGSGNDQLVAAQHYGFGQLVQQALGQLLGLGLQQALLYYHELVGGQARENVSVRQSLLQPVGYLAQQRIGLDMAQGIVDVLESVQIDMQQAQAVSLAARRSGSLIQTVGKQAAVGQLGQRVMVGEVAQLFLGLAAGGQVGKEADVMGDFVMLVAHYCQLQPLRVTLATAPLLDDLTFPAILTAQGGAHAVVGFQGFRVAAAGEQRLTDHIPCRVAGNHTEGLVDCQYPVLRVEDEDAVGGGFEYRSGQAFLLMLLPPCGDIPACAHHAQGAVVIVTFDSAAVVFYPHPVPLLMAHPVFDAVGCAVLEVIDQRLAYPPGVIRMHQRREIITHGQLVATEAEDFLQMRVVDRIGVQVPVP